ncbi:guanine nucleotide exchange protein for ADP-robosylation factor [Blyttiomyces sp. JEL0837]|nr:guanine nucleotide exchange protein for ADP-robosylation factor [Blyttiomyces sp. JEL0837]
MYSDTSEERRSFRGDIEKRLIPLSQNILVHFNNLDPDSKRRNVNAWRPVVYSILHAISGFDDEQFKQHLPFFYNEIVNLLMLELSQDIRTVMHAVLLRTGSAFGVAKVVESTAPPTVRQSSRLVAADEGLQQ